MMDKMISTDSIYQDALHTSIENNNVTNGQIMNSNETMTGENEGMSPFARIEEILKAVYKQEYTEEHLNRFRLALVDDAKVFDDDEFMKMFPSNDTFWDDLLPEKAAKFDFFRKVKAHPTYANV